MAQSDFAEEVNFEERYDEIESTDVMTGFSSIFNRWC